MTKFHNFVAKFGLCAALAGVLLQGSGCSKQTDLDDENQSDELAKSNDGFGNHNGADAGDSKIADSGSVSPDDHAAQEDDAEGAAGDATGDHSCMKEGDTCFTTVNGLTMHDGVCIDIGDGNDIQCHSCNPGINDKNLKGYRYSMNATVPMCMPCESPDPNDPTATVHSTAVGFDSIWPTCVDTEKVKYFRNMTPGAVKIVPPEPHSPPKL